MIQSASPRAASKVKNPNSLCSFAISLHKSDSFLVIIIFSLPLRGRLRVDHVVIPMATLSPIVSRRNIFWSASQTHGISPPLEVPPSSSTATISFSKSHLNLIAAANLVLISSKIISCHSGKVMPRRPGKFIAFSWSMWVSAVKYFIGSNPTEWPWL